MAFGVLQDIEQHLGKMVIVNIIRRLKKQSLVSHLCVPFFIITARTGFHPDMLREVAVKLLEDKADGHLQADARKLLAVPGFGSCHRDIVSDWASKLYGKLKEKKKIIY